MNVSLIIAAGGSSQRFLKGRKGRRGFSKLFLTLAGKPLLAHTLDSFKGLQPIREIILVVPPRTENWVKTHVLEDVGRGAPRGRPKRAGTRPAPTIRLVRGGKTRAESVWKALLKTSPKNPWVLVHDGARPFPPAEAIRKMLRCAGADLVSAREHRAGTRPAPTDGIILGRPVIPTLKRVTGNGFVLGTVDRTNLFEAETPQLVRRSALLQAYRKSRDPFRATDESLLIESTGGRVKIHPHSEWNVKVTAEEDLQMAETHYAARHCEPRKAGRSNLEISGLLRRPFGPPRNDGGKIAVGFGRDTHRLVKGRKFYLGGVRIPFEKGALGHSDGDALLHAVADAVLGAVGSGDIGEWFSDQDPRHQGVRSGKILKKVLEEARRKGWCPAQMDSVITLERPRLGNRKKEIRQKIAKMLALSPDSVSVKAKTQEGLGSEGEGLAVTCEAIVLLSRGGGFQIRPCSEKKRLL